MKFVDMTPNNSGYYWVVDKLNHDISVHRYGWSLYTFDDDPNLALNDYLFGDFISEEPEVEFEEEGVEELTLAEVSRRLGYKVKIVKD
jgi:hypothetical protein